MSPARYLTTILAAALLAVPALAQGGPPPMPGATMPQSEAPSWYAGIGGTPQGPFTAQDLRARDLAPDTLVWREGMAEWAPISAVPELNAPVVVDRGGPPPLPVPVEPTDTTEYFVAQGGQASSPLDRAAIGERLRAGSIDAATLVWFAGQDAWRPLGETRLAALLPGATPPGPRSEPRPEPADEAVADPAAVVVGTWRARVAQPVDGLEQPVLLDMSFVYGGDGRFSSEGGGTIDLRSQGVDEPIALEVRIEGTWQPTPIDAQRLRAVLKGTIEMAAPQLDLRESEPLDETIILEIVDPDTLRDGEGNVYTRAG
ncbi:DUF4339 domain-containing protein [Salinarimonas chemoclinalis]|uniref:DUF4339 domain-containing protein n=1 Tax=Salinarimonas chemoclinalis TaxID=3241599 RepID=UPI0035572516